jgi:hypothetical protein
MPNNEDDPYYTNCLDCRKEILDTNICNCEECGLYGVCEYCYDNHSCEPDDYTREID